MLLLWRRLRQFNSLFRFNWSCFDWLWKICSNLEWRMVRDVNLDMLNRRLKLKSTTSLVVDINTESLSLLLPETDVSFMKLLIVWGIQIIRMIFILQQLALVKFRCRSVRTFNSLLLFKINELLLYNPKGIVIYCFYFGIIEGSWPWYYCGILDVFCNEVPDFIILKLLLHTWPVSVRWYRRRIVPSRPDCAIKFLLNRAQILEIKVQCLSITEKDIRWWLIAWNTTSTYPFFERLHEVVCIGGSSTSAIWRCYWIGYHSSTYSIILLTYGCFRCGSQTSDLLVGIIDIYFLIGWILVEQLLPELLLLVILHISCQPSVIIDCRQII